MLLWTRLRSRQPDVPGIRRRRPIAAYVLDFHRSGARLAVEIDGESHAMGDQPQRDRRKTEYLKGLGIEVLRIPAIDVLKDASGVAMAIFDACRAPPQSSGPVDPPPAPPLHGGASVSGAS